MMIHAQRKLMRPIESGHAKAIRSFLHFGFMALVACWAMFCFPALTHAACPGDVNADGAVDGGDIAALALQFGSTACTHCTADLDGDEDVDRDDLRTMAGYFGHEGCPAKPVITGGTVESGTLQPRPAENTARQFVVTLTGSRQAGTRVWVNSEQRVGLGDTAWSIPVVLQPGVNTLEVWLVDATGKQGESEWIDIEMLPGNSVSYEYDAAGRVKTISNTQ